MAHKHDERKKLLTTYLTNNETVDCRVLGNLFQRPSYPAVQKKTQHTSLKTPEIQIRHFE